MSKKWDSENMKTMSVRLRSSEALAFEELCKNNLSTPHTVLHKCVRELLAGGPVTRETALDKKHTEDCPILGTTMQMVKHECGTYNPRNLNPTEMVNWILEFYFRTMSDLRGPEK